MTKGTARLLVVIVAGGAVTKLALLASFIFDNENSLVQFEAMLPSSAIAAPSAVRGGPATKYSYLRYDEAGPKPIPGTARSHALPNAVPMRRTIPREYAEDKEYHLSQRTNTSQPLSILPKFKRSGLPEHLLGEYNWNHSYATDHRTLYLYNPSILPLHNTISSGGDGRVDDPDNLSPQDLHELTGGDPSVRYVAIYRAYTGCNCFGPDPKQEIMRAGEQVSYLAVALLDDQLDVVPGTDVLVDLNAGPRRTKYWRQPLEDCRIFVLRGGIYLLCNEEMKRLKIRRRMGKDAHDVPSTFGRREDRRIPYVYENINGDGMDIRLEGSNGKIGGGKNFNIFRSLAPNNRSVEEISTGPFDYYLQTYPSPHRYRRLVIPDGNGGTTNLQVKHPDWPDRGKDDPMAPGNLPRPSFDTPDAENKIQKCADGSTNCTDTISVPFFGNEDHGTACCVRLTLHGKQVMVGISHQKLSPRKPFWKEDLLHRYDRFGHDQFVSRFIAYDVDPPFDVSARSGWWCLGFADEEESPVNGGSTLAGRNTNARLDIFNDTYICPAIHFVSGFSEVVGDDSRAVIGYGVNDCHPRMFFVEKSYIVKLLEGNVLDTSRASSRNI